MSDCDENNVRAQIIESAGELFADRGFEGVTVRDIVQHAKANLGSLSYHFTNKDELYLEVLATAIGKLKNNDWGRLAEIAPSRSESAQGLSNAMNACIRSQLQAILLDRQIPWRNKLILRELMQPTHSWNSFLDEVIFPALKQNVVLHQKAKPDANLIEAQIWSLSLYAHASFYIISTQNIRRLVAWDPEREDFLRLVIDHVAHAMISAVNLPPPQNDDARVGHV